MRAVDILRMSLQGLRRTPLRSILTALGVIIGVAAVIAMVSIGEGATNRIKESLARPESQLIVLTALPPITDWSSGNPTLPPGNGLTISDYDAIKSNIKGIIAATIVSNLASADIQGDGRETKPVAFGIDTGGFGILGRQVTAGALFDAADVSQAASVCVVTRSLANELFRDNAPIGRTVRLNGVPFTLVGIVAEQNFVTAAGLPRFRDLQVFVPYTSLLLRLDRSTPLYIQVRAPPESLSAVQQAVGDLMEQRRYGRIANFRTVNSSDALNAYIDGSVTMTRLLATAAAISLIVGGVGIANIMLVSVAERTREIGIRLSIGVRCLDILWQFLAEALALSLFGGMLGIVVGAAIAWELKRGYGWAVEMTPRAVVTAFICCVATGVVFGYYPARRASQLNPIDALRAG